VVEHILNTIAEISKVFRQEADIVLIVARLLPSFAILCKYYNKLLPDYNMSLP
jgi:hypothetical protein